MGPAHFYPYINDINVNMQSKTHMFADDSVIYRDIHTEEDHSTLQQDLHTLADWSSKWLMEFNIQECVLPLLSPGNVNLQSTCMNYEYKHLGGHRV